MGQGGFSDPSFEAPFRVRGACFVFGWGVARAGEEGVRGMTMSAASAFSLAGTVSRLGEGS